MDLLEKEWFIQAPWGRICIVAWGNCSDPPVLLCHGRIDSAATFRQLLKLLPKNFYYIGMELPGNGRSDYLPPGLMINAFDLVYSIKVVVDHFRWEKFIYMAHSLGALLGKLYELSYPGKISLMIDLDPTPAYKIVEVDEFAAWFQENFVNYFNKYEIMNAEKETGPRYKKTEAIETFMKNRQINEESAELLLERLTEPAGNGYIRYTFDQRLKTVVTPLFSVSHVEGQFGKINVPILAIMSENSIKLGVYNRAPFALKETKNYRVLRVNCGHSVHLRSNARNKKSDANYLDNVDEISGPISTVLLNGLAGLDTKCKL